MFTCVCLLLLTLHESPQIDWSLLVTNVYLCCGARSISVLKYQ